MNMSGSNESGTVKVLVTGFGPFPRHDGGTYNRNSSHEITKLLPAHLPPNSDFNASNNPITILNPTSADGAHVRVEYAHIRSYTSALHTAHASDVDLIVHVGMADGWDFVSMERRAYKQGFTSCWGGRGGFGKYYVIKDAAGKNINDTGECPWGEDVPVGLCTGLDVDGVVEGAKGLLERCESVSSREIKAHEDAGTYCCGFIYYESLANKYTKQTPAEVMFCHVPSDLDTENLKAGANAICAIIGSAVAQILETRFLEGVSQDGGSGQSVIDAKKTQALQMMAVGYSEEQAYKAVKFNA